MATTIGLFITVNPPIALMGLAVGTAVIVLVRRLERRSATAMTVGLGTILALSFYYQEDRAVILGLVGLGSLVTLRSLVLDQHRSRDSAEPANPWGRIWTWNWRKTHIRPLRLGEAFRGRSTQGRS